MLPLISGAEAKRYMAPETDTWLLFPYARVGDQVSLIPPVKMNTAYPKALTYLKSYEDTLRAREAKRDGQGNRIAPFDNSTWYRFGRNQNLDKQHLPKLIVAQTVPSMRICFDDAGGFALNNVRVNGILPAEETDPWFLLGLLNAPVADFVFRRIAKPKDGAWFEANKQFIAPLPIPSATPQQRAIVAAAARELQRLHTLRRDTLALLARRLKGAPPESWLLHGVPERAVLQTALPADLNHADRQTRAAQEYSTQVQARYDAIRPRLRAGAALEATLANGELAFLVDGVSVIDRVFVTEAEGAFFLAQWKLLASTPPVGQNHRQGPVRRAPHAR